MGFGFGVQGLGLGFWVGSFFWEAFLGFRVRFLGVLWCRVQGSDLGFRAKVFWVWVLGVQGVHGIVIDILEGLKVRRGSFPKVKMSQGVKPHLFKIADLTGFHHGRTQIENKAGVACPERRVAKRTPSCGEEIP